MNKNHQLNVLASQIELTYHKPILYEICEICNDPIFLTDLREYGECCSECKKWFCTKRYYNHKNYFESCAFKNIFGCFFSEDHEDNLILLCLSCVTSHIDSTQNYTICEHLQKSMKENKLHCNTIIIKNNSFYCEECDAIDNMVIKL